MDLQSSWKWSAAHIMLDATMTCLIQVCFYGSPPSSLTHTREKQCFLVNRDFSASRKLRAASLPEWAELLRAHWGLGIPFLLVNVHLCLLLGDFNRKPSRPDWSHSLSLTLLLLHRAVSVSLEEDCVTEEGKGRDAVLHFPALLPHFL